MDYLSRRPLGFHQRDVFTNSSPKGGISEVSMPSSVKRSTLFQSVFEVFFMGSSFAVWSYNNTN